MTVSPLKRTAILADALAAQFNRDPDRLADASGVYVRAAPLESVRSSTRLGWSATPRR